jgi:hypothetical protein
MYGIPALFFELVLPGERLKEASIYIIRGIIWA